MRLPLVLFATLLCAPASADPTCRVNERAGPVLPVHRIAEGAVQRSLPAGTVVELFTLANDSKGCPWALLRDPDALDNFYGWVDVRNITCR